MADIPAPNTFDVQGLDETLTKVVECKMNTASVSGSYRKLTFFDHTGSITLIPEMTGPKGGGLFYGTLPTEVGVTHYMVVSYFIDDDVGQEVMSAVYYKIGPPVPVFRASITAIRTA